MTELIIICGFLGSGKTTFLSTYLKNNRHKKLALIVNDFGKINVDSELIEKKKLLYTSITGGSLFCACRSDYFASSVIDFLNCGETIDEIIVESSGLSNPATLLSCLDVINSKSKSKLNFKGVVTICDATRLHKVLSTVEATKWQLVKADLILISKRDLNKEFDDKIILPYNSMAKIGNISFGKYDEKLVSSMTPYANKTEIKEIMDMNLSSFSLSFGKDLKREQLLHFLQEIEPKFDRIKGFLIVDGKKCFVEHIDGKLKITEKDGNYPLKLVLLSTSKMNLSKYLKEKAILYSDLRIEIE